MNIIVKTLAIIAGCVAGALIGFFGLIALMYIYLLFL